MPCITIVEQLSPSLCLQDELKLIHFPLKKTPMREPWFKHGEEDSLGHARGFLYSQNKNLCY